MKIATILIVLLLSTLVQAATLDNVALRSTDSFSICASAAANAQFIHSDAKVDVLIGLPESEEIPAMIASLRFYINDSVLENKIFKILFTSLDTRYGWQVIQGGDGEIYSFSTQVNSSAELVTDDGKPLGQFDLASCK